MSKHQINKLIRQAKKELKYVPQMDVYLISDGSVCYGTYARALIRQMEALLNEQEGK